MVEVLERLNAFVWGVPALLGIIVVGIYISLQTGLVQIKLLPAAIKHFFSKLTSKNSSSSTVTPFQALCTALAATVGTGNIVGVAGAISLGGPGAIFWMWLCAFLGMAVKFAEATLCVHFRESTSDGTVYGGPMYMLKNGLGRRGRIPAVIYSFLGVCAAFGVGNATQVNALVGSIGSACSSFGISVSITLKLVLGVFLAVLISVMLLGGAKRIGRIAQMLVPVASVGYILLCFGVIITHLSVIPEALKSIVCSAFSPKAATGGTIGSVWICLRTGVSRGVFTNEAGMGTAGIAHAGSDVSHPVEQGLLGIMEVFLDTIVMCTMTALAILCSGISVPYGTDQGILISSSTFINTYGPWVSILLAIFMSCFSLATVLGWGLYGIRCAQFLFGKDIWKRFVLLQACIIVISAILKTGTVWLIAETVNGLMALPNLLGLFLLCPLTAKLTKDYQKGRLPACGGKYENFHQRKSLRTVSYEKVSPSGCRSKEEGKADLSSQYWPTGY